MALPVDDVDKHMSSTRIALVTKTLNTVRMLRGSSAGMKKRVDACANDDDQIAKVGNISSNVLPLLLKKGRADWNTYLSVYSLLTPAEQEEVWKWKDGKLAYMRGYATFDELPIRGPDM